MTKNIQLWKDNVFPAGYVPPPPKKKYDLVVIGAGTAGLITAAGAAGLGADVALVESQAMGGDCLNVGCVPSKALIAAAKRYHVVKTDKSDGEVAFLQAMQQVREKRAAISVHDSVSRFTGLGVDIFLGKGKFVDDGRIKVDDTILRYNKAVIAVGAKASAPPIPGLEDTPYLTNEKLFELDRRPQLMTIVGAGPIGVEMAQSFARFGTRVQLVEVAPKILIREDQHAAKIIEIQLEKEGIAVHTGLKINRIEGDEDRQKVVAESGGETVVLESDTLLVAAGRKPNTADLGLENVGVDVTDRGLVVVDDNLRTTNKKIFSCGDVASHYQFTHAADFMARIVIQNSLFFGRKRVSDLIIPWVTYSEPEIAHVGAYAQELEERNISYSSFKMDFADVDRSFLEGSTGFCEILADPKSGKIHGATIVHDHAGEFISQITQAMQNRISLGKIASVIYPYPTQAEIIRKIGDAYNRTRLTPFIAKVLKFLAKVG